MGLKNKPKILIKWAVISIFSLLVVLILFFFWASSGTLPPENLAEIIRYPNPGCQATGDQSLFRIVSYNIGYLSGMSNNVPGRKEKEFYVDNMKGIVRLLNRAKPDFVGFQELDFHAARSHYRDQLESVASRTGFSWSAKAINWDKRYLPFPYWPPSAHFGRIVSGQAVTSRFPILENRRIVLEKILHKPFFYRAFYLDRLAQVVKIKLDSQHLIIINVHLEAYEKETRMRQARTVLDIYRSFEKRFPVLLIGDFNCVPPGASKKKDFPDEPGMDFLSHNVIELFLEEESLREAILDRDNPSPEKASFTFPSDSPNRRLDYIFYSHRTIICHHAEVLSVHSSDHLPVIMGFSLKNNSH